MSDDEQFHTSLLPSDDDVPEESARQHADFLLRMDEALYQMFESEQDDSDYVEEGESSNSEIYLQPPQMNRRTCPYAVDMETRTKNDVAATELAASGEFGTLTTTCTNVLKLIRNRQSNSTNKFEFAKRLASFRSRAYSGQFSGDGNRFVASTQDFQIKVYDSSNVYDFKETKTVQGLNGRWTITDVALTDRMLAYSTIDTLVQICSLDPTDDASRVLNFSTEEMRFGIWSLRFSADGRDLIAGANDGCIYMYDVETQTLLNRVAAHSDDVNSVCFADSSTSNVVFSGSDDSYIKIWDRRSLKTDGGRQRPSGVFVGHVEGITFIDSKNDDRYCISNGKDQALKLWDIRKAMSSDEFSSHAVKEDYTLGFDYRFHEYPSNRTRHDDCSVMTFRGHRVLKTLIRCGFSSMATSGQRFVFTGSADGIIHIYDTLSPGDKIVLDIWEGEGMERDVSYDYGWDGGSPCVRDVSWHPFLPVLASTGWAYGAGFVLLHEHAALEKATEKAQ